MFSTFSSLSSTFFFLFIFILSALGKIRIHQRRNVKKGQTNLGLGFVRVFFEFGSGSDPGILGIYIRNRKIPVIVQIFLVLIVCLLLSTRSIRNIQNTRKYSK